ncbi:MAG: zinc-ribbon domain-containing protein [Clostridiales bacterium]|nr:zinc-ribbon domain-containing protein [Clostridiales bacterium]
MGFIKKNLLKVIEWKDDSKNTVVYRFPLEDRYEIMTGSTLVVRESQMAVFVHKGQVADVFEPGTYKLSTENLPFITKILSLPTAFESPIKAEVYFVNTRQFTGQKWGTKNPIAMRDKDFGAVRLRGYGIYSFRVIDAKLFMKEMFGTASNFTVDDVNEHIRPILIQSITDTIASSKISLLDLAANYKEFGEAVVDSSDKDFAPLGLKLEKLYVENLSMPDEVEKAIDELSKVGIMEDKTSTYAKLEATKALRDSAKNPNGNNLAGLGVGLGAAGAMSGLFGATLNSVNEPAPAKAKTKPCIKCGAEISEKAKHCSECGAKQSATCPKCGEAVTARAKFCPNCGEKLSASKKTCSQCGEEMKSTAKFCPNCGTKN